MTATQILMLPYIGRRGDWLGTWMLIIQDHVVVYELQPDTGDSKTAGDVQVLRVFGPYQDRSQR